MRVLGRDRGSVRCVLTSPDDAWFLYKLLRKGDVVRGKVSRKVKLESDAVKRTFTAVLRVERCDYLGSSLRILGIVSEEVEDAPRGSHQSLLLDIGSSCTIEKELWSSLEESLLRRACNDVISSLLILVLDRESAVFAVTTRDGYRVVSSLKGQVARKDVRVVEQEFFPLVVKELESLVSRLEVQSVIVASPSFWKEDLFGMLPKHLQKIVTLASCSSDGVPGIVEVLKRSEVRTVAASARMSEESRIVDELLLRIRKGSRAAYGVERVAECASAGAVETLLISSSFLERDRQGEGRSDALLNSVEKHRGVVVLVSSEHEGGAMLDGLGGMGALLRFDVQRDD